MCIRRWAIALAWLAIFWVAPGHAAPAAIFKPNSVEYIYSEQTKPPELGWTKTYLPFYDFFEVANKSNAGRRTVWLRFLFDSRQVPAGRIALLSDYMTERFILFLNGAEVYRNYSDPRARTFASYEPAFVALPPERIVHGANEISIRLESDTVWSLGIGNVTVGAEQAVRNAYDTRYRLQFLVPQIINGILAALTICGFLIWLRRRQEHAFGWLTLVGLSWWTRNLHYSTINPVVGPYLMWEISVTAQFVLVLAFTGFVATVLDVPQKWRLIWLTALSCLVMIALRYTLLARGLSDGPAFMLTTLNSMALIIVVLRAILRRPSIDNLVMLAAVVTTLICATHDLMMNGVLWTGASFFLQPYASLIVFSAFLFALGRRVINALGEIEQMNRLLDERVVEASRHLQVSEAARRTLEVETAVTRERERLMMEIHDGIGSNLITALSFAEKKQASVETINILRQSITDLKVTVDSLEPIGGHVTSLLANLRHRLEPELTKAGLSFDWRVQDAPALTWLDAVGALHVLRILQEAIGNILTHSGGDQIIVECGASAEDGAEGVAIVISDTGCGFDPAAPTQGKGIANMESRAKSLHGTLHCESVMAKGTKVRLWLPLSPIREQIPATQPGLSA